MIEYHEVLLKRGILFRNTLASRNPADPDLPSIDKNLRKRRQLIVRLEAQESERVLLESTASTLEEILRIRDLRKRTYKLLQFVRPPSDDEKKVLIGEGWVVFGIEAKTLLQVVIENTDHFEKSLWDTEKGDWNLMAHKQREIIEELMYNSYPDLAHYTPPKMQVAINPSTLEITGCTNRQFPVQLLGVENFSRTLETRLPRAKAIMLPASVYAQADISYLMETGHPLFPSPGQKIHLVRALDEVGSLRYASLGRRRSRGSNDRLLVDHGGGYYANRIAACPAIVFI